MNSWHTNRLVPWRDIREKVQHISFPNGLTSIGDYAFYGFKNLKELNIPSTEVYGVATFYSQFTLKPKGKNKIGVCLGTACYVRGSQAVLDEVCSVLGTKVGDTTEDGKFSIDATRCVGACGLAPVMMINDEVYGRLTADQVPEILAKY